MKIDITHYRHVYAIGDLQGCFAALKALLKEIQFDPSQDFIIFTGDLVARGEDSLSCLRFVKKLFDQKAAATILGNHDLTLIATARGIKKIKEKDRTQDIFDAMDGSDLIDWLRHQPLFIETIDHQEPQKNTVIVHAGIPHIWSIDQVIAYAHEVEQVLKADVARLDDFLKEMYGSQPNAWNDDLSGNIRLRVITNYLTRMRLSDAQSALEFEFKEGLDDEMPKGYQPWFNFNGQVEQSHRIIFGHWAALQAKPIRQNVVAVDGGCVWGGELVAFNLKNEEQFKVFNPL